jgi:hypothetical protein
VLARRRRTRVSRSEAKRQTLWCRPTAVIATSGGAAFGDNLERMRGWLVVRSVSVSTSAARGRRSGSRCS